MIWQMLEWYQSSYLTCGKSMNTFFFFPQNVKIFFENIVWQFIFHLGKTFDKQPQLKSDLSACSGAFKDQTWTGWQIWSAPHWWKKNIMRWFAPLPTTVQYTQRCSRVERAQWGRVLQTANRLISSDRPNLVISNGDTTILSFVTQNKSKLARRCMARKFL